MSLCLNADEIMHIADAGCDDNSLFFLFCKYNKYDSFSITQTCLPSLSFCKYT